MISITDGFALQNGILLIIGLLAIAMHSLNRTYIADTIFNVFIFHKQRLYVNYSESLTAMLLICKTASVADIIS